MGLNAWANSTASCPVLYIFQFPAMSGLLIMFIVVVVVKIWFSVPVFFALPLRRTHIESNNAVKCLSFAGRPLRSGQEDGLSDRLAGGLHFDQSLTRLALPQFPLEVLGIKRLADDRPAILLDGLF